MQAVPLRVGLRRVSAEVWEAGRMRYVPDDWAARVKWMHSDKGGSWTPDANAWLLDATERLAGIRLPASATDADICDLANRCAREAMNLADGPVVMTLADLRARLEKYVDSYGIKAPPPYRISKRTGKPMGVADAGAVRRMTDAQWWRRALRRHQARAVEREAIALGYVHRRGEIYASTVTVERRAQQRRRNASALEATQAINLDTGEIYSLAELAERANSNPAIRRGELMTRIAGFEAVARERGHDAEFVTVTAPSRYHAKAIGRHGAPFDNPKYAGATPRETQGYLTKTWAACRAALARYGVALYGFRIVEPHHDGTPHWHCLFFMPAIYRDGAALVPRFRAIVRRYFLRADKGEAGAKKRRVTFEAIDWSEGTAAGYIAKYVSKNIDGFQVQSDLEGENMSAVTGSQRVEAWASTWGIRQFQQIGGAPVGVWRELRRMRSAVAESAPEFEEVRAAADAGDWRRYVEHQGGPTVERRELRYRVAYTRPGERWDNKAGESMPANPTRYGEVAPAAVFGVMDVRADRAHVSRFFKWEIRRANGRAKSGGGMLDVGAAEASPGVLHSEMAGGLGRGAPKGIQVGNGAAVLADWGGIPGRVPLADGFGFESEESIGADRVGVGFGVPRTRVNNCTGGANAGAIASIEWAADCVGCGNGGGGSSIDPPEGGEDQGGSGDYARCVAGIDGGGRPSDRRGGGGA